MNLADVAIEVPVQDVIVKALWLDVLSYDSPEKSNVLCIQPFHLFV